MPVFFVCAGLLGLLAVALAVNVGLMRGRKRINLGDGGDAEMQAAVRAHGNLVEFAPLTLLMIYMASDFYGFGLVAALSVVLLVARLLHAGGMLGLIPKGRLLGTLGSTAVLGIASILLAIAGLGLKQY
ncbi:MAPEG family protein [Reyranella sp.]|uniref:MAPEG family protein n=1 Tax=Reyranella sp. TaxID=1929291 RepID=UPI003C7ABB88